MVEPLTLADVEMLRAACSRSLIEWAKDTPKGLEVYSLLLERRNAAPHAEPVAAR
jgi:hypothetical protein